MKAYFSALAITSGILSANIVVAASEAKKCVDLSGVWSGTCTEVRGETSTSEPSTVEIKLSPGCDRIRYRGEYVDIDSSVVKQESTKTYNLLSSIYTYWKSNKQELAIRTFVTNITYGKLRYIMSAESIRYMRIENDLLIVEEQSKSTEYKLPKEKETNGHQTVSCSYERI